MRLINWLGMQGVRIVRRIEKRQAVVIDGNCLYGGKELMIEINGKLVIISIDAIKGRVNTFGEIIRQNGVASGINIVVQYVAKYVSGVVEGWIKKPELAELLRALKVFLMDFLRGAWEKVTAGFWMWFRVKWSVVAALCKVIETTLVRKITLSLAKA